MRKPLGPRQWLVWVCWAGGMSIAQTAESLYVGIETVKKHRKEIRRKGWDWRS